MNCDTSGLGEIIQSGILIDQEEIEEKVVVEYNTNKTYYILIEYLNNEENNQNSEQGKSFQIELGYKGSVEETLVDHIIKLSEKETSIEKIEHETTEQTPSLIDYRYTGSNPNNYVYFGCIIIVQKIIYIELLESYQFKVQKNGNEEYENKAKLIKASNYEGPAVTSGSSYTQTGKGYRWNTNGTTKWEDSSLKNELNINYWNSLEEYQKYISSTKWYLGAPHSHLYTEYTPEQFYIEERSTTPGRSGGAISYVDNIGLMYPSDYGYSIDSRVWKESIYNNKALYQYDSWL